MDRPAHELPAGMHTAAEGKAEEDREHQEEDPGPAVFDHEPDLLQEFGAEEHGERESPGTARTQLLHSVAFYRSEYKQEDCYRL